MAAKKKNAIEAIKQAASGYPNVEEGTSCSQTSYKVNKKAFLYIGLQGGRYKAMFKLSESMAHAKELAEIEPECYEVGSTAYVTARFTDQKPMPTRLWKKWLDESYQLSAGKSAVKKTAKGGRPTKGSPIKKNSSKPKKKTTKKKQ